ncbi:MAG: DUF6134 family protein, partial [Pseudomonadota bacterium]|nr:DUF6134 family protein [Pseudomonadota bacterium]
MNFSWKIRVFCAVQLLAFGLNGAASSAGVPKGGVLAFDIVRNGEAIGTHTYRFDLSGDRTEVRIKTDINFRLFFIPVYRFEHESKEVWQNGKLDSLESNTNENGTPVKLQVHRDEDSLMVYGEDGNLHVDREIIPASLWNRLVLDRSQTLTTISGNVKKFEVEYVGEKELEVRGKKITTQHFRLTGEFERELWYDKDDVLVGVRFVASDGSTVAYVL